MDIISYNKAASAQKDLNERVLTNVPVNAVFTDTTYSKVSEFENDLGYLTQASVPEVSEMMKKGPDIPANADLNTYTSNGFFHQNLASNVQSGSNYPSSKGGMLTVMADGLMVYHVYRNYDGTGVFHRTKYDSIWYTWEKVYDTIDNLPKYKLVDDNGFVLPVPSSWDAADSAGFYSGASLPRQTPFKTHNWQYTLTSPHTDGQHAYQLVKGFNLVDGLSYRTKVSGIWDTQWHRVWDDQNMGAGSGLDADKLDGQEGSYYRNASNIDTGTISGDRLPSVIGSSTTGNSATATKLETSRTITIGSTQKTFDGSSDLSFSQSEIGYTPADVLAKVKTMDGSGSGLDADKLDGVEGSEYARKNLTLPYQDASDTIHYLYQFKQEPNGDLTLGHYDSDWVNALTLSATGLTYKGVNSVVQTVWTSANDGTGSGLDSDKLDGQHGVFYLDASNINAGTISNDRLPSTINSSVTGNSATTTKLETPRVISIGSTQKSFDGSSDITFSQNDIGYTSTDVLTKLKTVDGSESGLDADMLDGVELSEITRSGSSVNISGDVSGTTTVTSSGDITLNVEVSNDSHNHSISTVDGLQSALNEKQANLVSGTNVKTLLGESLLGSGNIDLTKSSVGLGDVDNTSDLDKPISTAAQTAIDTKADKSQTNSTDTVYTDATTALGYKLYVDDGTIFLEEI